MALVGIAAFLVLWLVGYGIYLAVDQIRGALFPRKWWARCEWCDWEGPTRPTKNQTVKDANKHRKEHERQARSYSRCER